MNKLILKGTTGALAIGLLVATTASAAFAANTVNISGNGKQSVNTVTAISANKNITKQTSNTMALTFVSSVANSGNNKVNGNTGGTNGVTTGASTSTVTTTVMGGSNEAVAPSCGCGDSTDVSITGNGKKSVNTVTVVSGTTNVVKQKSNTVAVTAVSSVANTGGNTVKDNTNGTNGVVTGPADSSVETTVTGEGNTVL